MEQTSSSVNEAVVRSAASSPGTLRRQWYLSPWMWLRKIVSQDDTPHSLALGTAIGMFIGLTPTGGLQMFLVMGTAWLCKPFFRFNQLAGILAVYVSNPFTAFPIYWFNYWVGTFFVGGNLTKERLADLLAYEGSITWWAKLWELVVDIGLPLTLGSIIVGTIAGLITYPVVKWLATAIQNRHASKNNLSEQVDS